GLQRRVGGVAERRRLGRLVVHHDLPRLGGRAEAGVEERGFGALDRRGIHRRVVEDDEVEVAVVEVVPLLILRQRELREVVARVVRGAGRKAAQVRLVHAHRRRIAAGEIGRVGEGEAGGFLPVARGRAQLDLRAGGGEVGLPSNGGGGRRIADPRKVQRARRRRRADEAVVAGRRGGLIGRGERIRAARDFHLHAGRERRRWRRAAAASRGGQERRRGKEILQHARMNITIV